MPPWCLPSDGVFDHHFSGYSLWLEPFASRPLLDIMNELADKCGGEECGLTSFAPHVTLLYNIRLEDTASNDGSRTSNGGGMKRDGVGDAATTRAIDLLRRCLREYERLEDSSEPIPMNATRYYYFPYPKSADGGRGFGCVISMLLIENNKQLQAIHDAAKTVFPPDERHGEAGGSFQPHMALVYAPEQCGKELERWTDNKDAMERNDRISLMKAQTLSIWRTEGKIDNWNRVASLELGSGASIFQET